MDIDIRLADARDRAALDQFYSREGLEFQALSSRGATLPFGASRETMFIVASAEDSVVAALKLDIGDSKQLGKIGFIQHFEIEDELEDTDLGARLLSKTVQIVEEKGVRALDAIVDEKRADVIQLYLDVGFEERRREICLRKDFRTKVF
ncbi:MAG: GNAT family N-acetyltransferase [Candidatus Thorarchaeota archaeon]|jgi:GNAT superfamily N-acetyltransferase